MLELRKVTKDYTVAGHKQHALRRVSINFRESEFAAILGPSGSGKTTLLNIIGGLDEYTSGDLKINEISTKNYKDKDWDAYPNHRIGFVFQSYNLIPHQTILQNVKLALTLSGISKKEATRRAKKALEEVGLKDHIEKRPAQLSGGQMQRVAIARALVNDPDILLADEPTGALDSETSLQIMDLLKNIASKKLIIMVTHNPDLATEYATRIITLKDGEITSDSNPYDGKVNTNLNLENTLKKTKKTKMSYFTALALSLNNLLTKRTRTLLISLAGSIGIIGIALILAISTGFQSYIDHIEEETLTSYPLTLMEKSTDMTSLLLSATSDVEPSEDGKIKENKVLTSMLDGVAKNDLKSFIKYLNSHYSEVENDLRLVEYQYSVDPLIYTIDATNKIAKLNPSNLYSSILGDSSLLNSYSSLTSTFRQQDRSTIERNTTLLAGRYPEEYNELVVMLSHPGSISDLLTYSLGFHDTSELASLITKILSNEKTEIDPTSLELTYDDLLNRELKLVAATDLYKYNDRYYVYEDMSADENYLKSVYENSEPLKIVGVVTPKDNSSLTARSGVLYLPSLVTHIIEKSAETDIVKRQLASPNIDVFSNTVFGTEKSSLDLEFSDFVSVDSAALSRAFGLNLDQNALLKNTENYLLGASSRLNLNFETDILPILSALTEKYSDLTSDLTASLRAYIETHLDPADPTAILDPAFFDEFRATFDPSALLDDATKSLIRDSVAAVVERTLAPELPGLISYLKSTLASSFYVDQSALLSAFHLNFEKDELARIMTAMLAQNKTTYSSNLISLGYQPLDDPSYIFFYFNNFDGKTAFLSFLDHYNEEMKEAGEKTKVIEYTDTTGVLMQSVKIIVDAISYVLIAFVSISLVVSSIMIGVITYISVYERTKEIGILRAIGASKRNISSIFTAETFIIGLLSGLFAILFSYIIIPIINAVLHHFTGDIPLSATLPVSSALLLIILSVILTLIGGFIPSRAAAKKDPVEALRSE